jgi:hypothetical protein
MLRTLNCMGFTFISELLMFVSDPQEARNVAQTSATAIRMRGKVRSCDECNMVCKMW